MSDVMPPPKVLLIDDEPFMRTVATQILTLLNIPQDNILEADTARDGMKKTLRFRPDVVLCDVHMPEENGFVYLSYLRKAPKPEIANTLVIMLTSDSTESAVLMARGLKVDGYLVKPVSVNSVKVALERAFGRKLS